MALTKVSRGLLTTSIVDNGNATAITIDSSENVGIGASPATQLFVKSASNAANVFAIESADALQRLQLGVNTSNGGSYIFEQKAQALRFGTSDTERLRIDQNGWVNVNANIATDNPADSAGLHFGWNYSNAEGESLIVFNKGGGSVGGLLFSDNSADGTPVERMRIASDGNVEMRGSANVRISLGTAGTSGANNNSNWIYGNGTNLRFNNAGGFHSWETLGTERMRIDSSGNLLVGTTSAVNSAKMSVNGNATTFVIHPAVDNNFDCGHPSYRWDDIRATNGTIQTSDRNEKQDIAELTDAEQRVAVAAKGLMRKFRWISSVQENGDNARIHFGIIAQDLQDAFTVEGLDAGRYAMFISDTWWETQTEVAAVEATEDTEAIEAVDAYTRTDTYDTAEEAPEGATERTRLGVRYNELLAFIISAT